MFENRTARELASQRPRDREELLRVWGIGATRVDWFGRELLRLIADWESEHPEAAPRVASLQPRLRAAPGEGEQSAAITPDDPLFEALRAWRSEQARDQGVPAYTICSDRTLRELVATRPASRAQLLAVWGLGESRVARFGDDVLRRAGDGRLTPGCSVRERFALSWESARAHRGRATRFSPRGREVTREQA